MSFKKILLIFISSLVLLAPASAVVGENLTSYWSFDNGADILNDDESTFDLNVDSGGATQDTSIKLLGAGSLDCDADAFSTNSYTAWAGYNKDSTFAVSMWIYPDDTTTSNQGLMTWTTSDNNWLAISRAASNDLSYNIGSGNCIVNSSFSSTGQWFHVVLSHASDSTTTLYQNNVAIGTCEDTRTWSIADIEVCNWNNGIGGSFNGRVDDIALFDYTLTATQVSDIYNNGAGCNKADMDAGTCGVAGSPSIAYVSPTPANLSKNKHLSINISMTNTTAFSNITLNLSNTSGFINSSVFTTNPAFINYSSSIDGTYYIVATGEQSDGQLALVGNRTITLDTTAPANVTNLINITNDFTQIIWNWTLPSDSDLNDTLIYVNNSIVQTGGNFTNYTLSIGCNTTRTISVQTRDDLGNIGSQVNHTAQTQLCPAATTDLQLYYEFNDDTGTSWLDSTGNGYTGVGFLNPTRIIGGIQAFGVDFSGAADQYINSTLNLSTLTGNQWSIQTWLNFDTHGTNDNIWSAKSDTGSGASLWYNNTAGGLQLELINDSGGVCQSSAIPTADIGNLSLFNHIVFSFDGSHGRLFVNNTLVNTTANCPLTTFSDTLTLNRHHLGSGAGHETDGTFDEVVVWNRSLGDDDIDFLYNSGNGRSFTFLSSGGISTADVYFSVGLPENVSITFNHDTTTGYITYTWNDLALQIDGAYFITNVYNTSGAFLFNTNATSGTDGTLRYNVTPLLNNNWSVYSVAYINDTNRRYVTNSFIAVGTLFLSPTPTIVGEIPDIDGGMYAFFMILFMVTFGLLLKSAVITLITALFGVVVSSFVFLDLNLAFVGTLGIMFIIIMWVISKTR